MGSDLPQAEMKLLCDLIETYKQSRYNNLGIIVKTNKAAKEVFDTLCHLQDVHLISPESSTFEGGISVTSVQMAKGLEFDEVILMDCDSESYRSEYDRSLLYVACTRAMHKLSMLYSGRKSPFLPK